MATNTTNTVKLGNARERFNDGDRVPIWIRLEHLGRYQFAKQFVNQKTVVECACADGQGTQLLLEGNPHQVYGFDVDKDSIEIAKATVESDQVEYRYANSLDLPLEDNSIDAYISLETIEHIDDVDAFLTEVSRVLTKDGSFVCSTPNREIVNPGKYLDSTPWNPFHIREFTPHELANLLSSYFAQVDVYGMCYWPHWQYKLLSAIGKFNNRNLAVRAKQLIKLVSRWRYRTEYQVTAMSNSPDQIAEFILIVAQNPLQDVSA